MVLSFYRKGISVQLTTGFAAFYSRLYSGNLNCCGFIGIIHHYGTSTLLSSVRPLHPFCLHPFVHPSSSGPNPLPPTLSCQCPLSGPSTHPPPVPTVNSDNRNNDNRNPNKDYPLCCLIKSWLAYLGLSTLSDLPYPKFCVYLVNRNLSFSPYRRYSWQHFSPTSASEGPSSTLPLHSRKGRLSKIYTPSQYNTLVPSHPSKFLLLFPYFIGKSFRPTTKDFLSSWFERYGTPLRLTQTTNTYVSQ